MIPAVVSVLGLVLVVLAFIGGRNAGRAALLWELETDTQARRDLLEHLARLERVRIVGRE